MRIKIMVIFLAFYRMFVLLLSDNFQLIAILQGGNRCIFKEHAESQGQTSDSAVLSCH